MKVPLRLAVAAIGLLLSATSSQAQTITWGTVQAMTDSSDISTAGTYLDAASFYGTDSPGSPASQTLNGVTFNPIITTSSQGGFQEDLYGLISISDAYAIYYGQGAFDSTDYGLILAALAFNSDPNGVTITLSGLTSGDPYQVQAWAFDPHDSSASVATTLTGSTNVSFTNANAGQFVLGTFTATGPTETFNVKPDGGTYGIINGISVFDTAPSAPEPSTYLLVALGFLGLIIYQRRKFLI